jgi:hypothetical protein
VVVDLDDPRDYPLNFVCNLPYRCNSAKKRPLNFNRIFGTDSPDLARKLLFEAFEREKDVDIKDHIKKRIKMLPK